MTAADRVTPNPPSPYATADPTTRHVFGVLFGADPQPGALALTLCDELAVVPADPLQFADEVPLQPGMCETCVLVVHGKNLIRTRPQPPGNCAECGSSTDRGQWCALCRMDLHEHHTWQETPRP